jgi:hypothetical protein
LLSAGTLWSQPRSPAEVFDGKTGDPKTLGSQVKKLEDRFGLSRVVLVEDRA